MLTGARAVKRVNTRRHEDGSALMVAMLMLVLMGMIGIASLDTVMRDRQVAGFQTRSHTALYAADAGVATATSILAQTLNSTETTGVGDLETVTPALPVTSLGDAYTYPYGQPSFKSDPAAANPIHYLGKGKPCDGTFGGMSIEVGSPAHWFETLWEIRVQGQTADQTPSRIQATSAVCFPFGG